MKMFMKRVFLLVLLLIPALVACSPTGSEPEAAQDPTPAETEVAEEALPAARQALADFLGIALDAVQLDKIADAAWPNGCLGLAEADEMCTEAIVPGFEITFIVDGTPYVVRTDEAGSNVRVEAAVYPASVVSAREQLALDLNVPTLEIDVLSFEEAEWSDSCLGLGGPAESCAAVITPGWRVMLSHAGTTYEVRTDRSGTVARVADPERMQPGTEAPLPEMGGAVAMYQRSGGIAGELVIVRIYADGSVERETGMGAQNDAVELLNVEPSAVETLLADLEAAGYGTLQRAYLPQDSCCDRYFYLTAAEIDGEVVAVETMEATEEAPEALWQSIQLLEHFIERAEQAVA